jgi:hypothetical protein
MKRRRAPTADALVGARARMAPRASRAGSADPLDTALGAARRARRAPRPAWRSLG